MSETSGPVLRQWLLTAVRDLGGSATRADVHARIEELFGPSFTPQDLAPRVGRRGEAAWRNNVDSLYDRLKKLGVMETQTHGAPWRLSPRGKTEAAALPHVAAPEDALQNFRPKDGGEYLARLRGRTLRKSRLHDPLLRLYGTGVARFGWQPSTTVHPRDLELRRGGEVWLGEVKIVYNGNATEAARAALAQLLEYRHYFYAAAQRPGMLAIFSESIGSAHAQFLSSVEVHAVWRTATGWDGVGEARRAQLVP